MNKQLSSMDTSDKSSQVLHQALHSVYRSLIQQERVEYERLHGEQSEDDFIQVLAHSGSLRWMDELTRLIVLLELFEDTSEYSPNASRVVARKVKGMVAIDASTNSAFSSHYQRHLQSSETLKAEHDALIGVLDRFG